MGCLVIGFPCREFRIHERKDIAVHMKYQVYRFQE